MMWRLSVGTFMLFVRYETPMSAGFRKYALLYRKAATMQSRDCAPTRPVRPPIGESPLLIHSRRDRLRRAFISSDAQVQRETLETITLVDDGLLRLGDVDKFRFVASKRPLDRSMHKISHRYVGHYDDPRRWMFSAWMKLTDKGQQLALSLEERAIDSYREHEVTQDFSTHKMAEPTQLRAQITAWNSEGDLLHRDVA
jgi:hypothetical protein